MRLPPHKKSATLADVAALAGLSMMTVSRYLNGRARVAEKTARRVKAAIDALGYRPNQAARMLMGQPSRVIGLILPNLANPFFSAIAHSVQQTAHANGYLVWIAATNDQPGIDLDLIARMKDHHVDGILLTASPRTVLTAEMAAGVPFVALDRPVAGVTVDSVMVDDRSAARDAVTHLIGHGYRRIACFGLTPAIHSMHERIAGYREAMRGHGLAPLPYMQCDDEASALRVLRKATSGKKPAQAIFPANGRASVFGLEALSTLRLSIPRQVAFLSYGEIPLGHLLQPPLSAVRQPTAELGARATMLLLERIGNGTPSTGRIIRLQASLILRSSCGCGYPAVHSSPR